MRAQVGALALEAEWGALSEHLYGEEREGEGGREGERKKKKSCECSVCKMSWR